MYNTVQQPHAPYCADASLYYMTQTLVKVYKKSHVTFLAL